MIIALAIPRAAWTAAFALLWRSILALWAKGSDGRFRLSDDRKLEVTSDPVNPHDPGTPQVVNVGQASCLPRSKSSPLSAPSPEPQYRVGGSGDPKHVPRHSSGASFPDSEEEPFPYGPSPYTEILPHSPELELPPVRPLPHDPNATPEQALREADALWQTLQHALQTHISSNLSTPPKPSTYGPEAGLRPLPPSPDTGIYLIAHNARHLNILTLVLKRIQNSRVAILQALDQNTPTAPAHTPADIELLTHLQQIITTARKTTSKYTSPLPNPNHNPIPNHNPNHNPNPDPDRTHTHNRSRTPNLNPESSPGTANLPIGSYEKSEIQNPQSEIPSDDPNGQKAMLHYLLNNISANAYFQPDPNATIATAIRQCDALWQTLQTAIPPLTPFAVTPHDLNNLTTALWRIANSRQQALALL